MHTWYTYAKNLSLDIGIELKNIQSCKDFKSLNVLKNYLKRKLIFIIKKILEIKIENIQENNKLYLYKFVKIDQSKLEYYLNHPNFEIRRSLTNMKKERIWSYIKETTPHLRNKPTKNIHLGVATRSSTKWKTHTMQQALNGPDKITKWINQRTQNYI